MDASSNVTAGFLETNEQNLISLAQTSRPVLGVFAKYSPEYPCLLNGLTRFNPMISEAFGARRRPGAEPEHHRQPAAAQSLRARATSRPTPTQSGPDCRGLTDIDAMIAAAQHERVLLPDARRPTASTPPTTRRPATPSAWAGAAPNDVPPGRG